MTDPQPVAPPALPPPYPLQAQTSIIADGGGNVFVMLELTDGTVSAKLRFAAGQATAAGTEIARVLADADRAAAEQARRAGAPALFVPPGAHSQILIPRQNGGPRG